MLLSPQSPTPGTGSEVWLETQGPREKQVVGKAAVSTVRAHQIFLYLGTWDVG